MKDLRQQICDAVALAATEDDDIATDAVIDVIDEAVRTRCTDGDCVRHERHSVLGPHLWRHAVQPPVTRAWFTTWCFMCGHRAGHRIHKERS